MTAHPDSPSDANASPARLIGRDETLNQSGQVAWSDEAPGGIFYPDDTAAIIGPDLYVIESDRPPSRVEITGDRCGQLHPHYHFRLLPDTPAEG